MLNPEDASFRGSAVILRTTSRNLVEYPPMGPQTPARGTEAETRLEDAAARWRAPADDQPDTFVMAITGPLGFRAHRPDLADRDLEESAG